MFSDTPAPATELVVVVPPSSKPNFNCSVCAETSAGSTPPNRAAITPMEATMPHPKEINLFVFFKESARTLALFRNINHYPFRYFCAGAIQARFTRFPGFAAPALSPPAKRARQRGGHPKPDLSPAFELA